MSEEAQPLDMQGAETAFATLLSGKEPEPTESEALAEEEQPSQAVDHLEPVEDEQEYS